MKPVKALTGTIDKAPDLKLHILLTEEDNVVVARCLDFSISSHGENEEDALASLTDSIKDYFDYAIKNNTLDKVIDPDEKNYWDIYRELELKSESFIIKEKINVLKADRIKEVIYA